MIEEMNFRTFKHGFFLTHFLSVTSRKNQNISSRIGVNFSLNRPICSHSSKAVVVSGLLLLKVIGNSKNDKNSLFHEYFVPLTHTIVKFNLSLKTNTLLPPVWVYASYGNRTHVNSLEGCYAYTTSTMLKRFTIEEMIFRTFKQGFFLTHFLNVTSRKNQKNSLRSWVNFSLNRPICSHSLKAVVVSGLLLLKVIGNSKNDKNSLFHEYFVPLTHTIVKLNLSLKLNILLPPVWVYASYGNRTHVNSLEGCYATTTPTMLRRFTIKEMNLRTFKLGFFLTNILSVTSEKTKTILWEADSFFANQTPLFLINRKLSFLVCYFWRTLGIQKETRIYYFMSILSP